MQCCISHKSALEFFRGGKRESLVSNRLNRSSRLPVRQPEGSFLKEQGYWGLALPLDILISEERGRWPSEELNVHLHKGALPDRSFFNVGEGLLVSSLSLFEYVIKLQRFLIL